MPVGISTLMPSLTLSLPKHVEVRPRKDGTFRVLFAVRRDRPENWPPSIPLPLRGKRTGDLANAGEVARIVADVEGSVEHEYRDGLLWKLDEARAGTERQVSRYPSESLPAVAELWEASWIDKSGQPAIRARTQEFYRKGLRILKAWTWLPKNRLRPMRSLDLPTIIRFLETYADRPAQRGALRRTLSALFSFAMMTGAGGVKIHPFGVTPRLKRRLARKRGVGLWTPESVNIYATGAAKLKLSFERGKATWPAAARLVRLMWETSADQTDVVTWRRDQHFRDTDKPAIMFDRGKTGEQVVVPISRDLADDIRGCGSIYFVVDPFGRPYRADDVKSDNQRGAHFRKLQDAVVAKGGPRLLLDHLRHSAITHALESGAPMEHVPSLSGHRDTRMAEQIYGRLTEKQALNVQRLRGIVD